MLSLRPRSDQTQAALVPAWHPNLRNHERLPDTKVVRTRFFVNFAAIMVAASLLVYFCFQEYRIKNLSRQVAEWQTQIENNKKSAAQAVMLSKKFADEEAKINELKEFLQQRLVMSEFLLHLGSTLPEDLVMDAVEVRPSGVNLRGTATGSPEEASGRALAYGELIKRDKYFSGIFDDFSQDVKRDQGNARLTFELFLRFKEAPNK
jgi:Tfp pilus assembly protein PilN